jgi:hypothetical protein
VSDSLLTPMSQSRLDEGSCSMPPSGSSPEGLEVQLDTAQRTLLQRETEVSCVGPVGLPSCGPWSPLMALGTFV